MQRSGACTLTARAEHYGGTASMISSPASKLTTSAACCPSHVPPEKRDELPRTGHPLEREYELSSIHVSTSLSLGEDDSDKRHYGTRSSVALAVTHEGHIAWVERYMEYEGSLQGPWKEVRFEFDLEAQAADDGGTATANTPPGVHHDQVEL